MKTEQDYQYTVLIAILSAPTGNCWCLEFKSLHVPLFYVHAWLKLLSFISADLLFNLLKINTCIHMHMLQQIMIVCNRKGLSLFSFSSCRLSSSLDSSSPIISSQHDVSNDEVGYVYVITCLYVIVNVHTHIHVYLLH